MCICAPHIATQPVEIESGALAIGLALPVITSTPRRDGFDAGPVVTGTGGVDVDGVSGSGFNGGCRLGRREGRGRGAEEHNGAEDDVLGEHGGGWVGIWLVNLRKLS
jgi:hypothetical protein